MLVHVLIPHRQIKKQAEAVKAICQTSGKQSEVYNHPVNAE